MMKVLLTAALTVMTCMNLYAQSTYEWRNPPKPKEKIIGTVIFTQDAGSLHYYYNSSTISSDSRKDYSDEQLHEKTLQKAKSEYGARYPRIALRNFKSNYHGSSDEHCYNTYYFYDCSATVVVPDIIENTTRELSQAINKALRNVQEGSRIAIDQVTVWSEINRDEYKRCPAR